MHESERDEPSNRARKDPSAQREDPPEEAAGSPLSPVDDFGLAASSLDADPAGSGGLSRGARGGRESVPIPKPAGQRLSLYLRYLESRQEQGRETISSQGLGSALGLTAAQVRKDLGHFGQFGLPGVGYKIPELIREIRRIIGTDRIWKVALVGMGNLGSALAYYRGFEKKGFQIVALFDADPAVIGNTFPQGQVLPMEDLPRVVREEGIDLGILAVPSEAARDVARRMSEAGIQGVLNFAPKVLRDLPGLHCVSVDLAIQLEQLALCITVQDR